MREAGAVARVGGARPSERPVVALSLAALAALLVLAALAAAALARPARCC